MKRRLSATWTLRHSSRQERAYAFVGKYVLSAVQQSDNPPFRWTLQYLANETARPSEIDSGTATTLPDAQWEAEQAVWRLDTVVLLVEPERLGGAARVYLNLPDIDNLDLGEPV